MNNRLLFTLICFVLTINSYGQGSTVPDSVRAMIERSQAANRFEQTARMQVGVQFGDFIDALAGDEQRKSRIEAAFIDVLSERAELSSRITTGQGTAAELEVVSDYDYLRSHLAPLLSSAELSLLDNRRNGPTDAQLKKDYAEQLSRAAVDLSEVNRELVLDTLIKYIRVDEADTAELARLSVDDLVIQQIQSIMRAKEELQPQLSVEQFQQATVFLDQLQSNLFMNRSMSGSTL